MQRTEVLIVGGGHGGAQTAIALRGTGFAGSITILGRDHELPYELPPLSKDYLSGEKEFARIMIRPAAYWQERQIEILTGRMVVSVDPGTQTVRCGDGESFAYGTLVWATGGDPRRLTCPGHDLTGVHTVRNRAEVDAIIAELGQVTTVAVVGGGYIGLEAAAVLTKLGRKVVLLEALPRVLARVAGEELSAFYEAEHRAHGVELRTGAAVEALVGEVRVSGVRLASGETIAADMVIVGIGIIPGVGALLTAGAAGGNGVDVDAQCRTSLPHIYAVGDCAAHSNRFAEGAVIRLESVQNATDMGTVAARTIAGEDAEYNSTPWFWSNQYDLRLQTVGLSTGYDQTVVRGDRAARSFSVIYLRGGKVIALDCVNTVRDYAQGRKLVEQGTEVDPLDLADTTRQLKEFAVLAA